MMMINFSHDFTCFIHLWLPYFVDVGSGGIEHLLLELRGKKRKLSDVDAMFLA